MEFGLDCMTQPDTWKDLLVAEDLGFTHAWMIDSPLICSERARQTPGTPTNAGCVCA